MLTEFFRNFNPEVILNWVSQKFYQLASLFSDYVLIVAQEPILGIKPLMTAIEKIWACQRGTNEDTPYTHQVLGSL